VLRDSSINVIFYFKSSTAKHCYINNF